MAVSATNEEEEPDIWENGCASDIWSLGITIFEIITMIPIWMNDLCVIRYASSKKQSKTPVNLSCPQRFAPNEAPPKVVMMKPRKGFLATDDRKVQKMIEKQKSLYKHVRKSLDTEIEEDIDNSIVQIVKQMIVFDPSQRINVDQILHILK